MYISCIEEDVLAGSKDFALMDHPCMMFDTWLTLRARQCAIREAVGLIKATKESAEATKKKYKRPKHCPDRAMLSSQCVRIKENPGLKDFDLLVELRCFDARERGRTIAFTLKKTCVFNKWNEKGKLGTSVLLTKTAMQFSFKCQIPKKKDGDIIGLDPGAVNLLTDDNGKHYGTEMMQLLRKQQRKKKGSNGMRKARAEVKAYVNKTCKEIDWDSIFKVVLEDNRRIKFKSAKKHRMSKGMRSVLSNWIVGYMDSRIEMLCQENGVSLARVPSYYNSQTCPVCGSAEKKNRATQDAFKCLHCGYADNADTVGATNALARFVLGQYGAECQPIFYGKHPNYRATPWAVHFS
jgi:transposase